MELRKQVSSAVVPRKKRTASKTSSHEKSQKEYQKKRSTECWGYRRATTANTLKNKSRRQCCEKFPFARETSKVSSFLIPRRRRKSETQHAVMSCKFRKAPTKSMNIVKHR